MLFVQLAGGGVVAIALLGDGEGDDLHRWRGHRVDQRLWVLRRHQHVAQTAYHAEALARLVALGYRVEEVLGFERVARVGRAEAGADDAPALVALGNHLVGVVRLVGAVEGADAQMHDADVEASGIVSERFAGLEGEPCHGPEFSARRERLSRRRHEAMLVLSTFPEDFSPMPETMRAVLCRNPRDLEIVERPVPVPKEGEALVRVRRIGVCGTDMHIYQGNQPYFVYPRVMGHELSGEIVEPAKGSNFRAGDPVYIVPYLECGHCIACRVGRTNCCTSLKVLGVHIDGGMCEYLSLPETHLFKAEGITLDEAAMVEFLAIGAHAVARAKVSPGQRALVVGSGPIGVGVAIFAKLNGAEVTVIDGREDRLAFATSTLKLPHTVQLGEGDEAALREISKGEFFHHVFDCTGSPKAMERGFSFVAHGGTYVLVSIVQGNISFSDPEFHKRETTLLSSRNATLTDFATVMNAMREDQVPTKAIKTHSAPLWEAAAKMPEWIRPDAGTVKAVLEV